MLVIPSEDLTVKMPPQTSGRRRFAPLLALAILLMPSLCQGAISFVQQNSATPQTPQTAVAVVYKSTQTSGNLNVVVVGWSDTTTSVATVTDTKGNTYKLAVGPTRLAGAESLSIYYANNIVGANPN